MSGACIPHERDEKRTQSSGRKTSSDEPTWKPKHRWNNNIRMDIKKVRYETQDKSSVAGYCEHLPVP